MCDDNRLSRRSIWKKRERGKVQTVNPKREQPLGGVKERQQQHGAAVVVTEKEQKEQLLMMTSSSFYLRAHETREMGERERGEERTREDSREG